MEQISACQGLGGDGVGRKEVRLWEHGQGFLQSWKCVFTDVSILVVLQYSIVLQDVTMGGNWVKNSRISTNYFL